MSDRFYPLADPFLCCLTSALAGVQLESSTPALPCVRLRKWVHFKRCRRSNRIVLPAVVQSAYRKFNPPPFRRRALISPNRRLVKHTRVWLKWRCCGDGSDRASARGGRLRHPPEVCASAGRGGSSALLQIRSGLEDEAAVRGSWPGLNILRNEHSEQLTIHVLARGLALATCYFKL